MYFNKIENNIKSDEPDRLKFIIPVGHKAETEGIIQTIISNRIISETKFMVAPYKRKSFFRRFLNKIGIK